MAIPATRQQGLCGVLLLALCALLLQACATAPPRAQDDLCQLLGERPDWYRAARQSEADWGLPVATQLAFIRQESAFRARARPPRTRILGLFPGPRPSSAYGYPQALDGTWNDYRERTGQRFARRSDMADALDFVGWYNRESMRRLGLRPNQVRNLYLAYHEGHGGYQRGTWRGKTWLLQVAERVEQQSQRYHRQLQRCEADLQRARRWF